MTESSYTQVRTKMYESLEKGEVLDAIKTVAEHHRVHEFRLVRNKTRRGTGNMAFYDTFAANTLRTANGRVPVIYIGLGKVKELEKNYENYPKEVETDIEWGMSHEVGHNKPVTRDKIIRRQRQAGLGPYGWKATRMRESQAEIYAAVKYHEGRTLDELIDAFSSRSALAMKSWKDAIDAIPEAIRDEMVEKYTRSVMRLKFSDEDPWMNPAVVEEIAGRVVKKYRDKEEWGKPKSCLSGREKFYKLHEKAWNTLLFRRYAIESLNPEIRDETVQNYVDGYIRIRAKGANLWSRPEVVEELIQNVMGKYKRFFCGPKNKHKTTKLAEFGFESQ